ncbi:GNAT family N-acetyltransferase [Paenibacillus sp. J5C_2022]|uniref:GNAT family N-acetyltransferase n=1 Tax=Paenibacillus sp. J5C2022 TaxID=2977129 RepID=UPI0021D312A4|nr:GNAT family N-acetyltransferase [Paenibacillus sp. J5C2022]MCU6707419.1 GNAT family N-acetyltransferase [Paenibacillus sp. J5C2022]
MSDVAYRENAHVTPEQLAQVFSSSGIRRPSDDMARLQLMIDHADLLITAWDGDKPIGVARALTDYSYCCYLSDLAVDRAYQKHGIGKELVAIVQERIGESCSLVLLAAPQAVDYYPRLGFERADKAYLIKRKR